MKELLRDKWVGIAGAGGLGSNCAVALARCGVGHLVVADFDVVSRSNLNRQHYYLDQVGMKKVKALKDNIARIDPEIEVVALDLKLDAFSLLQVFKSCQVLVEAFDHAAMKKMMIETVMAEMPEKWLVAASGLAGVGSNNLIRTRRFGRLFICGDGRSEVSREMSPLAPRVGMVASMQANQVLRILLNFPRSGINWRKPSENHSQ